jgi:DNA-binding winged helix-turn-helix (wHTH) protein/tetratricopeptide (TPR) repeat protein
MEPQTIVRFGVFEADFRSGELLRNGVRVRIQDLPFRMLKVLIDRPGEIITRDDFRRALWPEDIFVDFDRGISSAVKRLRDALGDSADNPIFVETVERRGYRWLAPISIAPIPIALASNAPATSLANIQVAESHSSSQNIAPLRTNTALPAPHQFSPWKLLYVLPLLALLVVILRFGSRPANAGLHPLHPANQQAKDLYLQGRYYWSKRTPDDLHKAVDYFTQAIVHDPGYAEAYVGLADCYNLLREYTAMPANEAWPRALAAAAKAVELDENSSQAHASLAFASFWGMWDATTSGREFRRAIELDPNNAIAHHWYAITLSELGRFPDALTEIGHAQSIDPSSRSILADKAVILFNIAGRQKEAIDVWQQMEKADPAFVSPHRYLKSFYLLSGDDRNYLAELRQEAVLTKNPITLQIADAAEKGFSKGGEKGMLESLRLEQQTLFDQGKFDPFVLARTYSLSGNKANALKYLQIALDQHSQDMPSIANDRYFESLRSDPSFRQIQTATKLPFTQTQP